MSSEFRRRMRSVFSKTEHKANGELISLREWFYSLSVEMRQEYMEGIRLSAEAEKRLIHFKHDIDVRFALEQYDENGNAAYGAYANQQPKKILKAIKQWNETEELFAGPDEE